MLAANVLAYAGLVAAEGDMTISARLIANWGGLLPLQWLGQDYWRFLTAGFLHFSPMHIASNMICLLAWGVPLERMLGTARFFVIFLGSILTGSVGSVLLHEGPFVGAGASGGTSGLLGALLTLWLMRRMAVSASFFLINIGLNIAVALFAPGVDWQAHLFGFLGGMAMAFILLPRWR
ncbi:COG0705 Membrane associated serine protease [Rhabdaerophilaceae bacterium]